MALIKCPECNNQISDKADNCIFCGCPSSYYASNKDVSKVIDSSMSFDYRELKNVLIMFYSSLNSFFGRSRYISQKEASKFYRKYEKYANFLKNPFIQRYIKNNHRA